MRRALINGTESYIGTSVHDYLTQWPVNNQINEVIRLTRVLDGILNVLSGRVSVIDKVFGNLVYDKEMSRYIKAYQLIDFYDSIRKSESV